MQPAVRWAEGPAIHSAQGEALVVTHKSPAASSLGAFTPLSAAGGVRPGVYAGFAVIGYPQLPIFLAVTPVYGRPVRRTGGRPVNGPDNRTSLPTRTRAEARAEDRLRRKRP